MNVTIISVNQSNTPVPVVPYRACVAAESASRQGHEVRFLDLMFSRNPTGLVTSQLAALPS